MLDLDPIGELIINLLIRLIFSGLWGRREVYKGSRLSSVHAATSDLGVIIPSYAFLDQGNCFDRAGTRYRR